MTNEKKQLTLIERQRQLSDKLLNQAEIWQELIDAWNEYGEVSGHKEPDIIQMSKAVAELVMAYVEIRKIC